MNAVDSWTNDTWNKINGQAGQAGLLETVMGKIRIAQQVFPTTVQGDDKPVPADTIDLKTSVPSVGQTKPVVKISKSFQLAEMHVKDPQLTMAMNQVTLAGQSLALVEERSFFRDRMPWICPKMFMCQTHQISKKDCSDWLCSTISQSSSSPWAGTMDATGQRRSLP